MMIFGARVVIILMAFILVVSDGVKGQDKFNDEIHQSYIRGDISNWSKLIDRTPEPRNNKEEMYEYALAHYGFVGYCVYMKDRKIGRIYQKKGMDLADKLLEFDNDDP